MSFPAFNSRLLIFAALSVAVVGYFVVIREAPLRSEELTGKNILITGASTGIGEDIAYHYARAGAKVFLVSRRKEALGKVAAKCVELGAQSAVTLSADLGVAEDIAQVAEKYLEHASSLDHLVLNHKLENNVGPWTGSAENMTRLDKMFKVNFYGYVLLASSFLPLLEKANGSIGVVSSTAGRSNIPYLITYSSTKHALDGFFNGWRLELEANKSPVSITYCTLGLIDTKNMRKELSVLGFVTMPDFAAANANETALAIVTAIARRDRELYFPWLATRVPLLFRFWFPELLDKFSSVCLLFFTHYV